MHFFTCVGNSGGLHDSEGNIAVSRLLCHCLELTILQRHIDTRNLSASPMCILSKLRVIFPVRFKSL